MLHRLLGSELITWKYIRAEQITALLGATLIMFLALCAYLSGKCISTHILSSATDIQVQVFFESQAPMDAVRASWDEIRRLPEVSQVRTFTPSQALHQMQEVIGPDMDLSWTKGQNLLPPTAVIHASFADPSTAPAFVRQVQEVPQVKKVHSNPLEVHAAQAWTTISATVLWPLLTVLLLTLAVLLANTIRMSLGKLQTDIQVLRLVGAPRWACHTPILTRMITLTLVGTLLAVCFSHLTLSQARDVLSAPPLYVTCPFLSWIEIGVACLGACAVCALSCTLAIHRQAL